MSREVTSADIQKLMLRNYRRYSSGVITEAQAYKENALLGNILKAIEASQTEKRLEDIEEILKQTKEQ
jgi:hypothetical protein